MVTHGTVIYQGQDLLKMLPGRQGAGRRLPLLPTHQSRFRAFALDQFLRAGYNAVNKSKGLEELDPLKFDRLLRRRIKSVNVDPLMTRRFVNEGFSGGEKKRNEILQMAVLEPKLAILDEPDSGLDVDALRSVAQSINDLRTPENLPASGHPLPANSQLRGSRQGPRTDQRPHRQVGRQGTSPGN